MSSKISKFFVVCGIAGPVFLFLSIFILPFFFPGYNPINQTISELGFNNSPVKVFMNTFGFNLVGILVMLFSIGIFKSKEISTTGKISSFFFFLTGLLMFFTGIFPGENGRDISTTGMIHNIVSNYQFGILAVGLVLLAFDVGNNKKLRILTPLILIVGWITLVLAYIFLFPKSQLPYRGIIQRLAICLPYLLIMILAMALYKIQSKTKSWVFILVVFILIGFGITSTALKIKLEKNNLNDIMQIPGICYGEENCSIYCKDNYGSCSKYCKENPGNQLCQKGFAFEKAPN